jgi:hypothetical protein
VSVQLGIKHFFGIFQTFHIYINSCIHHHPN